MLYLNKNSKFNKLFFSFQFSPKTLPQWAEDHKSLLQMLCQQVEALKVNNFCHCIQCRAVDFVVVVFESTL